MYPDEHQESYQLESLEFDKGPVNRVTNCGPNLYKTETQMGFNNFF